MPMTPTNDQGIEICFETFGDPADPTLLMIMGLGAQMVAWDEEFCSAFVDRGFHVVRFDNRDVGLSTKPEVPDTFDIGSVVMGALSGELPDDVPYLLSDMAADVAGLLDHLGIDRAHVMGASMGGMVAQQLTIDHPERVATLTSVMSTTGDLDVGQPTPEVLPVLLEPSPPEREASIAHSIEGSRAIGSPEHFEEDRARRRHERSYDRCFYPAGVTHQLAAVIGSGSRSAALAEVELPALVIHGDQDPLVSPSGGERTAEVIPGAELVMIEGMGHDMPSYFWAPLIEGVTSLASRAASTV